MFGDQLVEHAAHGARVHAPGLGVELDRVVIGRPFPPQIASTYSARVAGDSGITLLDAAECWIYQHSLRHMGEIEHARGLVGLQGMTS